MAITRVRYPFDKTGASVTNLVSNETRTVDHEFNRAWAPAGGSFYGDSLVMMNADDSTELKVGKDYQLLYPDVENTAKIGLPIYSIISLTNKSVINVRYGYQVVGGDISFSIPAIVKMLNDVMQDNSTVTWDNIWGKPVLFQPAPHLHDASTELVGLEYIVLALEEMTRVINQGDVASHNVLYDYINRVLDRLKRLEKKQQDDYDEHQRQLDELVERCIDMQNQITANKLTMDNHIANKNNPHQTTKAQVGLGNVDNFPTASQSQAEGGTDNGTFMTPLRTWQEIVRYSSLNIMPIVNAHIADKNNPHQTTKAQVGLGSVADYPPANQQQAEAATDNATVMTPLRVGQYAAKQILPVLNAHVTDYNNPHKTTKAQVGLGQVADQPPATQVMAEAGVDNGTVMSPLRTWQAITKYSNSYILPTLNAHVADKNNPHGTTAAQVGLGNVANYRTATQAEGQAGSSNGVYMTPWSTYYEIMRFMPEYVDPRISNLQAQIDALTNRVNSMPTSMDASIRCTAAWHIGNGNYTNYGPGTVITGLDMGGDKKLRGSWQRTFQVRNASGGWVNIPQG